ncbi:stage VI sporulation protein F [Paenibacillus alkalitolerans]|uniref:stage VI sporulation protein F n=1 Tax=Paenibacillus alkalitolerans TaxID=2799335 RepID=UPI0018F345A9|nr:stage VI sporulation protein F [Paenibacillus alkalitolerans]
MSNLSKNVLDTVKKNTGKSISQQEIQKLAGKVGPQTMKNEANLRQLIKNVAAMAKTPVSESTIKEIIRAVKSGAVKPGKLDQMMKMMGKK